MIAVIAQSEAVRKFAEKIKCIDGDEFIEEWIESGDICYAFNQNKFDKKIDEIVKEMWDIQKNKKKNCILQMLL